MASTIIHSQVTAINFFIREDFLALGGTLNIDEISVCESSRLTGSSIYGDTDIGNVADFTEELVEIGVGHFEGEVANEKSL